MTYYPPQGPQPPYGPPPEQPWSPTRPSPHAAQSNQNPAGRVKAVSITLIVFGALDLAVGLLATCGRVASTGAAQGQTSTANGDDPARLGGYLTYIALTLMSVVVGALIVTAGIQLSRRKGRSLAATAAVLALLPISCGWLFGVPIGIWTLVTLRRDDVRALLGVPPVPNAFYPPPPTAYPGNR